MITLRRFFLIAGLGLAFSFSLFKVCAQTTNEAASKAETAGLKKSVDFESSIKQFEQMDQRQAPPQDAVVFVGSSSIRKWTKLAEDFPEIPVINRGFGGSIVADSVKFADRIVIPYHPRVVIFYAGGNDIEEGWTPAQVAEQYKAFDEKVLAALPSTTIIHISLNPTIARARHDAQVKETNRLLEEYVKTNPHLIFIETYSKIAGPDGLAQKDWMQPDGIHMNDIGYQHWKEIIKPVILDAAQKAGVTPLRP